MPKKVKVYDTEEGVELTQYAVTAEETVSRGRGRYTVVKPAVWPPAARASTEAPAAARVEGRLSSQAAQPGASDQSGAAAPNPPAKPAPVAPSVTTNPVDAPDPFEGINGLGPKLSIRLRTAGIKTLGDLANSTPEILATSLGVPGKTATVIGEQDWIGQAKARLTA